MKSAANVSPALPAPGERLLLRTMANLPEGLSPCLGPRCVRRAELPGPKRSRRALGEMLARRGVQGRAQASGTWRQPADCGVARCEWDE
jgi:hypothetical protein